MNIPEALRGSNAGSRPCLLWAQLIFRGCAELGRWRAEEGREWDWRRPWPRDHVSVSSATRPELLQTSERLIRQQALALAFFVPEPSRRAGFSTLLLTLSRQGLQWTLRSPRQQDPGVGKKKMEGFPFIP